MTLPDQNRNALLDTYQFLIDLQYPKRTPRVPRKIRMRAAHCLHHYPYEYQIKQAWDLLMKDVDKRVGKHSRRKK